MASLIACHRESVQQISCCKFWCHTHANTVALTSSWPWPSFHPYTCRFSVCGQHCRQVWRQQVLPVTNYLAFRSSLSSLSLMRLDDLDLWASDFKWRDQLHLSSATSVPNLNFLRLSVLELEATTGASDSFTTMALYKFTYLLTDGQTSSNA